MILAIDTTDKNVMKLSLKASDGLVLAETESAYGLRESQELLLAVEKLLKSISKKLSDLKSIEVANGSGGFSNLRLGIATANALAYALGIPLSDQYGHKKQLPPDLEIVTPEYDSEQNIG